MVHDMKYEGKMLSHGRVAGITVQHKTLAGENFGGFGRFPVNRQSFIHQIL